MSSFGFRVLFLSYGLETAYRSCPVNKQTMFCDRFSQILVYLDSLNIAYLLFLDHPAITVPGVRATMMGKNKELKLAGHGITSLQ